MPISQCPRCELKFSNANEMRWHLREDHPRERATESTPLTVPVTRRGGATLTDPDPLDPQDPAPTPPGRRAALWWRRWTRGDRS